MVTPFNMDGSLDIDGLTKLINSCIEGGVEYLVSLGTTGESATLNKEEKDKVIEHTIKTINGRVPLVVWQPSGGFFWDSDPARGAW